MARPNVDTSYREKMAEIQSLMDDDSELKAKCAKIKEAAYQWDLERKRGNGKAGDRTWLNEYYVDHIVDLLPECFKDGQSIHEATGILGITDDSLYKLERTFPKFAEAYALCKELSRKWWDKTGRLNSLGALNGNSATWVFNMKNRFGWTDKTEVDNKSSDGSMTPKSAIDVSKLDDETIEKILAAKNKES